MEVTETVHYMQSVWIVIKYFALCRRGWTCTLRRIEDCSSWEEYWAELEVCINKKNLELQNQYFRKSQGYKRLCCKEYQFADDCWALEYMSSWELFCQNCLEIGFLSLKHLALAILQTSLIQNHIPLSKSRSVFSAKKRRLKHIYQYSKTKYR